MQSISWQAHEYEYRPKTPDWFWAVGIVTVAIAVVSVIMNDILFAVLSLLGGFSLALYSTKHPQIVHVSVSEKAVRVNDTNFPFSSIKAFCVATDIRSPSLVLTLKKSIMPHVIIPLGNVDVVAVEKLLASKIEEVSYIEPIPHKIFDALGF